MPGGAFATYIRNTKGFEIEGQDPDGTIYVRVVEGWNDSFHPEFFRRARKAGYQVHEVNTVVEIATLKPNHGGSGGWL